MIEIDLKDTKEIDHYSISYEISRKVLKQKELEKLSGFQKDKNSHFENIKTSLTSINLKSIFYSLFPIFDWLPKYDVKNFLIDDIIAGITVAIFAIPQGMAYGPLASLDPIAGLYTAFFPVLIYFFLGTARQVSVGTFAVSSIITAEIVTKYADPNYGTDEARDVNSFSKYQVATTAAFACGIFHLGMFVLRLGIIGELMSESMTSAFTTGAAFHVLFSQIKDILGISLPRQKGNFKLLLSIRDIILKIPEINFYTIYISLSCMTVIVFFNELIKPAIAKKTKFSIPIELIVVIFYTIVSYFMNFEEIYNIKVVGEIPTGLPIPQFPPLKLVYMVAVDSIPLTVVSYTIIVSMGKICAKKDKSYEIQPNQELLAIGAANIFGSCFHCIPLACSLSRTMVMYQAGAKTQVSLLVSALIILILLFWLGPLFETLPCSILASIIIVSLKTLIWQFKDVKKYHKENFIDCFVWIGTFSTVVIIDIDIGLLTGITLSLFCLYIKGFKNYSCMLGHVTGTEIYLDLKSHKNVEEIPGVKIFKYFGSINFVTSSSFKKNLFENLLIDCDKIKAASQLTLVKARELSDGLKILIIDLSAVSYVDIYGYRMLLEVKNELKLMDVSVLLVNVNHFVYESIEKAVNNGADEIEVFSTIHDAVLYSENKI